MTPNLSSAIYTKVIEAACSTLELTTAVVRQKYAEMPHCLMEYWENGTSDTIVELRFDAEHITLSCHFGNGNTCRNAILLFDNVKEIDELINYLNRCYYYSFIHSRWALPACYLSIKPTENEVFVTLYKTHQ